MTITCNENENKNKINNKNKNKINNKNKKRKNGTRKDMRYRMINDVKKANWDKEMNKNMKKNKTGSKTELGLGEGDKDQSNASSLQSWLST